MLAGRLAEYLSDGPDQKLVEGKAPNGVLHELRRLHFDIASATSEAAMAALLKFTSPRQLLFGSDYRFVPAASSIRELSQIRLSAQDRAAIDRTNAERLLPRLGTRREGR